MTIKIFEQIHTQRDDPENFRDYAKFPARPVRRACGKKVK